MRRRGLGTRLVAIVVGLVVAAYAAYVATTADQVAQAPAQSDTTAIVEQMPAGLELARVVRVVDGDTIRVVLQGAVDETVVRLVGIDTPETVDPNSPVECYGTEASAYVTELLTDHDVYLEADPAQGDVDTYGRLLRYVWLAQGVDHECRADQCGATSRRPRHRVPRRPHPQGRLR